MLARLSALSFFARPYRFYRFAIFQFYHFARLLVLPFLQFAAFSALPVLDFYHFLRPIPVFPMGRFANLAILADLTRRGNITSTTRKTGMRRLPWLGGISQIALVILGF